MTGVQTCALPICVLKMVPSSSQWYAKSYKYLNETAGGRQKDEDE